MTQPAERQALSAQTLREWKAIGHMWQVVAADLAEKINTGRLHVMSGVPSTDELAREHGCSTSTALRAKLYLVEVGYLTADRRGFYVNGGD